MDEVFQGIGRITTKAWCYHDHSDHNKGTPCHTSLDGILRETRVSVCSENVFRPAPVNREPEVRFQAADLSGDMLRTVDEQLKCLEMWEEGSSSEEVKDSSEVA